MAGVAITGDGVPVNVLIRFDKIVIQFLFEFRVKFQRKNIVRPMRSVGNFDLNFNKVLFCLTVKRKHQSS